MFVSYIALWLAATATTLAESFANPVVYEDFSDNDVWRGPNGAFYFSASSFHFSPGAPILKSYDLVNWDFIGHSVPTLEWAPKYNMTGGTTAYNRGIWASTMRYRESNGLWYWIGCVDFSSTHVYTAPSVTGPWKQSSVINKCYYDCGLLIDDDDVMYVVYGRNNVTVAQLSTDGLSEIKSKPAFNSPPGYSDIEGNRLYKRNGTYYVLDDQSDGKTFIWKSDNIWGPWSWRLMVNDLKSPVPGGGIIDQGSLVETAKGDWYFMSFVWAYPSGRMPILAPITWGDDGFPVIGSVNGAWNVTYEYPLPRKDVPSWVGIDHFRGIALSPRWEWNHNPDPTKYTVDNGVTLQTVTVTDDLYHARNTLTQRMHGPIAMGTVAIDLTHMADGDRTGLAAFRGDTSWIGIERTGRYYTLMAVQGASLNTSTWQTHSNGSVVASRPFSSRRVWFRLIADIQSGGSKLVNFSYSTDGIQFTQFGEPATLSTAWNYFMGIRFGIFNYATKALGGHVKVISFDTRGAPSSV